MPQSTDSPDTPREKFRSSCDSCAASKVRCKKERPKCLRCQRLGIECVYGPSRRKGKPPANRTTWNAWNSPASSAQPDAPADDAQSQVWQPDEPYAMSGLASRESRENTIPHDFLSSNFWDRFMPIPTAEFEEEVHGASLNSGAGGRSRMHSVAAELPITPPMTDGPSASHANTSPDGGMPDMKDGADNSCLSAALQILSDVYRLGSSQYAVASSSGYATPVLSYPSSDIILLTTRNVTATLTRLLSCTCNLCSQDLGLPFLLASVAAKVLHWYRAVHEADVCTQQSSAMSLGNLEVSRPSGSTNTTPTQPQGQQAVCAMPLKIGTLNLPHATEKRMKAQMLLCEIQPFVQACYMFSGRTQTLKQGQEECVIYEMFRKYLQNGAVELRRSLEGICAGAS